MLIRISWDNAAIESFHSNIKTEAFERVKHHLLTNEVTRLRVMKYMREYNEGRRQEKLGYFTPLEFWGSKQPNGVFYMCLK